LNNAVKMPDVAASRRGTRPQEQRRRVPRSRPAWGCGRDRTAISSGPVRSDKAVDRARRSALAPRLVDHLPARGLDPLAGHAALTAGRAVAVAIAPVAVVVARPDADLDAAPAAAHTHALAPGGHRNHDGGGGHQPKNHRTHHASSFGGLPMRTTPNPAKCFAPAPARPRFLVSGTFEGPISCESRPARRTKPAGTRSLQRNDVSALLRV